MLGSSGAAVAMGAGSSRADQQGGKGWSLKAHGKSSFLVVLGVGQTNLRLIMPL
jgi:hypothetical protein